MSLRTFAQRIYAARTFMARTFNGNGGPGPTDGWRAGQFNRVSVAPSTNRTAVAGELSRVVWASAQGK